MNSPAQAILKDVIQVTAAEREKTRGMAWSRLHTELKVMLISHCPACNTIPEGIHPPRWSTLSIDQKNELLHFARFWKAMAGRLEFLK
jgi:hypothetical protein